jgi:hypothetical protein
MNIKKGVLLIGLLMLVSGLLVVVVSNNPPELIRYVIAASALVSGVFAIRISQRVETYKLSMKYIWLEGGAMILYAIAVAFFAGNVTYFINATGLFLLVFAVVEFAIVLQVLGNVAKPQFKRVLDKLAMMVIAAVGAVFILTAAEMSNSVALLIVGLITAAIGVGYIKTGRQVVA